VAEPQGQAACFLSRSILKDDIEPKCFATVSVCEVFRAAARRDRKFDNVTECSGYDAVWRDRRALIGKIVLGVVGAFAVLSGFAWARTRRVAGRQCARDASNTSRAEAEAPTARRRGPARRTNFAAWASRARCAGV
jgi:hypothetical protein